MPAKRELDLAVVENLRNQGKTWQEIAVELGWNVSGLRCRLRQEGYLQREYRHDFIASKKRDEAADNADGVPIDWAWAEKMFMAGCELRDVAASFGVNEKYFSARYQKSAEAVHPDINFWIEQCRAKGRCALKLAQYETLLKRKLERNE